MPMMPHTTVSQNGMLSRSPGARSFPSAPMMMPPTRVTMIVQSMSFPSMMVRRERVPPN
jgi:hypothetical protein